MPRPPRATIDFETRSACSLKKCGAWRYSIDPSTEVLCLAYRLPYWEAGRVCVWHPAFPSLGIEESDRTASYFQEFLTWVRSGKLIEAHNAWFERCIWQNQFIYDGFPAILAEQWRCSAAKAAAHALPRGLDEATRAMNVTLKKDAEGMKVMKKMTKPRKPRKKEVSAWTKKIGMPNLWYEDRAMMERLWAYCRQDVLAEEALSFAIPDLSPAETQLYLLDQLINERGFQLDEGAVKSALTLIRRETHTLNTELQTVTNHKVKRATQRAQMLVWFNEQGVWLPNSQGNTIDAALLRDDLPVNARHGLEIVRSLGHSSTAKYTSMILQKGIDWRVRGGLLFHGATTGRWSGSGVQPHNFPKPTIKNLNIEEVWAALKTMDRRVIQTKYGSVMDALANGLRGAIVPTEGNQLYVADYASIEARVTVWVAGDRDALQIFERNEDIYCWMASDIYGYPCNKTEHPDERQMGKQAILGLGYQMGWPKFQSTVAGYGITIDDEFAQTVVEKYREKFYKVKQLWWNMEHAAIEAVQSKKAIKCGPVTWYVQKPFLYCQLPGGRCLSYPFPEIRPTITSWGAEREQLTYKGIDPYVHQWRRQHTYGGMLVENIVQAISRDIMAEAMFRCETSGYPIVLSVHDELIAEAPRASGTVHAFEALLTQRPKWALDCPIAAEGWAGMRYRK